MRFTFGLPTVCYICILDLDTRMAHGVQLFDGMFKRRQHT